MKRTTKRNRYIAPPTAELKRLYELEEIPEHEITIGEAEELYELQQAVERGLICN